MWTLCAGNSQPFDGVSLKSRKHSTRGPPSLRCIGVFLLFVNMHVYSSAVYDDANNRLHVHNACRCNELQQRFWREGAATRIQAVWRARTLKTNLSAFVRIGKRTRAIRVQRALRGFLARRELQRRKRAFEIRYDNTMGNRKHIHFLFVLIGLQDCGAVMFVAIICLTGICQLPYNWPAHQATTCSRLQ